MKKNIIKAIAALSIATFVFCGSFSVGYAYEVHKTEQTEREYLLDFIHYCQGNEGLVQIDPSKDYKKSSTHDLKELAKFYLEQDNYADVSDYWDVRVIEGIVYPKVDGRVITK